MHAYDKKVVGLSLCVFGSPLHLALIDVSFCFFLKIKKRLEASEEHPKKNKHAFIYYQKLKIYNSLSGEKKHCTYS
jgi:hypothetical protein